MTDQLEAWISAIENIQEELEQDIQEMKGQIARLTKLVKDHTIIMAMYSQGPSHLPVQPAPHILALFISKSPTLCLNY